MDVGGNIKRRDCVGYFVIQSPADVLEVDVIEEDHRVTLHPFAEFTHAQTSNIRNDIPERHANQRHSGKKRGMPTDNDG